MVFEGMPTELRNQYMDLLLETVDAHEDLDCNCISLEQPRQVASKHMLDWLSKAPVGLEGQWILGYRRVGGSSKLASSVRLTDSIIQLRIWEPYRNSFEGAVVVKWDGGLRGWYIFDVSLLSKFDEPFNDFSLGRDFYVNVLCDHLVQTGVVSVALDHIFFS